MTIDEAKKLKLGDKVRYIAVNNWRPHLVGKTGRVLSIEDYGYQVRIEWDVYDDVLKRESWGADCNNVELIERRADNDE
jgi:hypothetical protein